MYCLENVNKSKENQENKNIEIIQETMDKKIDIDICNKSSNKLHQQFLKEEWPS